MRELGYATYDFIGPSQIGSSLLIVAAAKGYQTFGKLFLVRPLHFRIWVVCEYDVPRDRRPG
jgi:hypothetical protein